MQLDLDLIWMVLLALGVSLAATLVLTPVVRRLAITVGAVDVPKDSRRMHKKPIPTIGGLAIFIGFLVSVLLFTEIDTQMRGILMGSMILVVLGVIDDIMDLPAKLKFVVQFVAAGIAVGHGCVIQTLSNPNLFSQAPYLNLGWLSIPVTLLWIVALTNAVNFIDGLDGLAAGVSAISAGTMLVIALMYSESSVAVVIAALLGACLGFLPFNFNPAKIFMGDTGATFLGYLLACMSVQGLFKYYAIVSFAVPFVLLGLPIFDICFAFLRRIAHGKSPMTADRSHMHHRLIDMGFSQKQAVAIAYVISALLGLSAVVLASTNTSRALILVGAIVVVGAVGLKVVFNTKKHEQAHKDEEKTPVAAAAAAEKEETTDGH